MELTRHNLVKIKVLYFLRLRADMAQGWCPVSVIAPATNTTRESLYVLLQRWTKWGLVSRSETSPYKYRVALRGRRYLQSLQAWYPWRNEAYTSMLKEAEVTFGWNIYRNGQLARIGLIKHPFQGPEDYELVLPNKEGALIYSGFSRCLIRKQNALEAIQAVKSIGLEYGRPLIQKLVDENYLSWNKPDKC